MKESATLLTLFAIFAVNVACAENYSSILKNKRLILEGATCAGIEFNEENTLLGYAEMYCSRGHDEPVTEERVKWISEDTFYTTQKGRNSEGCPPRNSIYRVEKIVNDKILIREFWTGWPDSKDSINTYIITKPFDQAR